MNNSESEGKVSSTYEAMASQSEGATRELARIRDTKNCEVEQMAQIHGTLIITSITTITNAAGEVTHVRTVWKEPNE